jgi:multidrug efflux pump
MMTRWELAPQEDLGFVFGFGIGTPTATTQQYQQFSKAVYDELKDNTAIDAIFQVDSAARLIKFFVLKPWAERDQNSWQVQQKVQGDLTQYPCSTASSSRTAAAAAEQRLARLCSSSSARRNRSIGSNEVVQGFMKEINSSGRFYFADTDLKIDRPQVTVDIDRDKTALLGLSMAMSATPFRPCWAAGT